MARILLAEDEPDLRASIAEVLGAAGHQVTEAGTTEEALEQIRAARFDLLLTDLRLPGGGGLELMKACAARMPEILLVVITAYGSLEAAIEALRLGAHDFLLKPLNLEALKRKVDLLAKHHAALSEIRLLRHCVTQSRSDQGLVGTSAATQEVRRLVAKVAPTASTVLITGETGTGKELVALAIHQGSPRRDAPFVPINCGAIPPTLLESELFGHVKGAFTGAVRDKPGLFEVAGEGTLFLDEIGEFPSNLQAKLLRTLENKEILRVGATCPIKVSARILAATHRDLKKMIGAGEFRDDLYYRLNVFEIRIPPLRERIQDLHPIAVELLARHCGRMNRAPACLEADSLLALEAYPWPGNVRELSNVLERALILAEGARIKPQDLVGISGVQTLKSPDNLRQARQAFERLHITRVIAKHGGDKSRAAVALGIDLSSLYRKLEDGPA